MGREKWDDGGYIRREKDGSRTWVIERQVGGRRFHISTHAHSASAAYQHLRRFETDPFAYEAEMRTGRPEADAVLLTAELVAEYREHLLERDRPATRKHANEMTHRLAEWAEDLAGRDLRHLELRELKAIVERRGTCKQHRIIALKSFFTWLRSVKFLIERSTDVTLDLAVPQAVPEKHRRRKAVLFEAAVAAMDHLAPAYQDCLRLLAHTGWHVTELERFARAPDARIAEGRGKVLAVLQVRHKTGRTTRTPIESQRALDAAKSIRERGALPRRMNAALRSACLAAGVEPFSFGVLRHSVATWAIEAGTPEDRVAEFLGHMDKSTTLRFYADVAVPTRSVNIPDL